MFLKSVCAWWLRRFPSADGLEPELRKIFFADFLAAGGVPNEGGKRSGSYACAGHLLLFCSSSAPLAAASTLSCGWRRSLKSCSSRAVGGRRLNSVCRAGVPATWGTAAAGWALGSSCSGLELSLPFFAVAAVCCLRSSFCVCVCLFS